jgi:hypothetical protein
MPPRDQVGDRLVTALWLACLLLLPWHRVWSLERLGTAVQPPELAFVVLLGLAFVGWPDRQIRRIALADAAVMAWAFATVISFVWSGNRSRPARFETVGTVYLVALYIVVRVTATPARVARFAQWFGYSAAIAASAGVIGTLVAAAGGATRLALMPATPVAYVGRAARAQALTAGPHMLASVVLLAIPLYIGVRLDRGWRRLDTAVLAILIAGLAATFSKTALSLPAVLAVMRVCRPGQARADGRARIVAAGLTGAAALALSIGTMFMVVRASAVPFTNAVQFTAGEPVRQFAWRSESWALMRTTYCFNHLASVRAIEETFPIGVGPKGQPAFTATLVRDGRYPSSIWAEGLRVPHSTYLGVPAEIGLAGVVAFLALMSGAAAGIRRLLRQPQARTWELAAYAGAGVGFCLEALSADVMNCRHYWWLLAIIASRAQWVPVERDK